MKRRVSSRDDLFLSALDMYTLLSLVLIGFAFVVSRVSGRDERLLELPTFDGKTVEENAAEVLTVRWSERNTCNRGENADKDCTISAKKPQNAQSSVSQLADKTSYRVPCCPVAFYRGALSPDDSELAELHASMGEPYPSVAIACDVLDPDGCLNLQWVMASGRFNIRAVTAAPNEVGKK